MLTFQTTFTFYKYKNRDKMYGFVTLPIVADTLADADVIAENLRDALNVHTHLSVGFQIAVP